MVTNRSAPQKHAVLFHGKSAEYLSICMVNMFLSSLTLGIYSAWGTVRCRRYLYSNTEINGVRFDYHARPLDLLKDRIIVIVALIALYMLSSAMPTVAILFVVAFLALIPWIMIHSWRYNALMSSYRGIRFNYHCRIGRAYWTMYICPILLVAALFLVVAMFGLLATRGSTPTSMLIFGGVAFVIFLAGLAVVRGIIAALNYSLYINNMTFGDMPFKAELSKSHMIKMVLVSFLIIIPFIIIAGFMMSELLSSLFYAFLSSGDPQVLDTLMTDSIGPLILPVLVLMFGGLISTTWLSVAQRNYIFSQTRLGNNIQLKSHFRSLSFLRLILTNTLIFIFTLGIGTPMIELRLVRYLLQSTALEGDLAQLNVHAHHDSARTALAEEVARTFNLNGGI